MPPFKLVSLFQPTGDQPQAIAQLVDGLTQGHKHQTLLGATGHGQDLCHGQDRREVAAPDAGHRAQQDPGRAALQRVQRVLPGQRGGVFRQLLRLLPAGSLHPPHRYLHRERRQHQRRDRPLATCGDPGPLEPARRAHRRLGLLHLRPGQPRGVRQGRHHPAQGRAAQARQGAPAPGRHPLRAQRRRLHRAASSASAAIPWRSIRPTASSPIGSSSGATRSSASWSWTP